jgi:hypothetical protein
MYLPDHCKGKFPFPDSFLSHLWLYRQEHLSDNQFDLGLLHARLNGKLFGEKDE